MNIEQFHTIADELLDYYKETNIHNELKSLRDNLANQEAQPHQAQFQQSVSNQFLKIQKILSNTRVDTFNPVWNDILNELGCLDYVGTRLLNRIVTIFRENTITPTVAKKEIEAIYNYVNSDRDNLFKIVEAFEYFKIGCEKLNEDEAELGIRIPRSFVSDNLIDFSKELQAISKEFRIFNEIVTGSRTELKLKSISSSEFNIFIEYLPKVAMVVVNVLEKVINIYKLFLDIKNHKNGLTIAKLPKELLEEISKHVDKEIEVRAEEVAKEIIDEYIQNDKIRKNELETELKFLICKLAYRIDNGFNFSVRCGEPNTENEDKEDANNEKLLYFEQIQKANKTLEFLKIDGEPILSLPVPQEKKETTNKEGNSTSSKKGAKKEK